MRICHCVIARGSTVVYGPMLRWPVRATLHLSQPHWFESRHAPHHRYCQLVSQCPVLMLFAWSPSSWDFRDKHAANVFPAAIPSPNGHSQTALPLGSRGEAPRETPTLRVCNVELRARYLCAAITSRRVISGLDITTTSIASRYVASHRREHHHPCVGRLQSHSSNVKITSLVRTGRVWLSVVTCEPASCSLSVGVLCEASRASPRPAPGEES